MDNKKLTIKNVNSEEEFKQKHLNLYLKENWFVGKYDAKVEFSKDKNGFFYGTLNENDN